MSLKVLMPLPSRDFDPSETGIPWLILKAAGIEVTVSTPDGRAAVCDQRMLYGTRLGPLKSILMADKYGVGAYEALERSIEFQKPLAWKNIHSGDFDGLLLAGGHARGMREYLESSTLQNATKDFFYRNAPVAAICHGVVLAARSKRNDGRSVLHGYKTTALLRSQELAAWAMTCLWLGNYYRTYGESVQSEVTSVLDSSDDFISGPMPLSRDNPSNLKAGFTVRDRNYLSARWPGDAHAFGHRFVEILKEKR